MWAFTPLWVNMCDCAFYSLHDKCQRWSHIFLVLITYFAIWKVNFFALIKVVLCGFTSHKSFSFAFTSVKSDSSTVLVPKNSCNQLVSTSIRNEAKKSFLLHSYAVILRLETKFLNCNCGYYWCKYGSLKAIMPTSALTCPSVTHKIFLRHIDNYRSRAINSRGFYSKNNF